MEVEDIHYYGGNQSRQGNFNQLKQMTIMDKKITYEVELVSRIVITIEADSEEEAIDNAIKEANESFAVFHDYQFDGYIDTVAED